MRRTIFALFVIIAVAVGFRFYQLGSVPPSPDWDEAALGYNAYSILKTGRDEYGNFLPLSIRSFDDYKPPLYVYLTVPSVALFGLSVWSTRLPSAVMGILAVLGTYFLVKELLKNNTHALLSAFLLAISPWSIQFSRIAFEANTGVTVNIWAVTAFLMGLKRRIFLPFSAVLFALGMYAYHSERVFLPLLIAILVFVYKRELFKKENAKSIVLAILLGILVVAPLIPVVFNQTALLRLRGTSSFTDQTGLLARDITKLEQDQRVGDRIGQLLDNRRIIFAKTIASGYLSHFSLKWLFFTGDNQRHHAPDMGLLYLWELPFLLYGMYRVIKYRKGPVSAVLVGWLLISPVAASPTTGLPHAVRTLAFLPVFQIFTAVGLAHFVARWRFATLLYGIFILFNIFYYADSYFVQTNPEVSEYWQYGYKDAVAFTEKVKAKYQKVIVSTTLEQSYMFFLFYTKYDPVKYLAAGGTQSGSFEEADNHFDTYEFRKIDWPREKRDETILYVGDPKDMPHGNVMNYTFLDGKPAIELADQPNGAL
jgi:4-amino-4-deoxy-L-arabinose transferase-like glycosyltransferase